MRLLPALLPLLSLSALQSTANAQQRTYANPIDIEYRYNFEQLNQGISYRSGADPVFVNYKGEYYLFETIAGGYWRSRDLGRWEFITPSRWPFEDMVAPAAAVRGDTIFLMQSAYSPRPILYTTQPATGKLEFYNRWLPPLPNARTREDGTIAPPDSVPPGPWDPGLFHDTDSDRWYLYWGSSNVYPIYGIELDATRRLVYKGTHVPLFALKPELHGWERFGQDHRDTVIKPYIEGAWMTKHNGRYYLQYGAPGTEYNAYANGTYVGAAPLGPFTYAPYNPIAYKPGGFMAGAGHGSTFQDAHGNWWNSGTPWVAVNWNFERRISLFPAGFDADGDLFVDTRFGDFPHWLPTRKWQNSAELFTGWMLLSYRKPAEASSTVDTFTVAYLTDENPRTFWVAQNNRPGETVTIDLGRSFTVRAVQVNYADYKSNVFRNDSTVYTQFRLHVSEDGRTWQAVADLSGERRDRPNAYVELNSAVRARFVRYEHIYVAAAHLAISDIRVFGSGDGKAPSVPAGFQVRRAADTRNAFVEWKPVAGAVGYNVRWGIAPHKLRQTYQVFADVKQLLEVRALNSGQEYWFGIEAFNENGVSRLSKVVHVR